MAGILSPDSRVMTGINKVTDMIWMSVLWCLMCLPLVWIFFSLSTITAFGTDPQYYMDIITKELGLETILEGDALSILLRENDYILMIELLIRGIIIGPATSALYYTMVKVIRRERGYATRTFFHGIKVNFRTGAPTSMIFVIFAILMVIDFRYVDVMETENPTFASVLNVGLMVVCILVLFILVWIFPLLSRFTISIRPLFKNAMLISIKHFIGSFILGGGMVLIGWFLIRFAGDMASILIIFPFILPALIALGSSFIIEPVLKRYTTPQGKNVSAAAAVTADDETGSDDAGTVPDGGSVGEGDSGMTDGEASDTSGTDADDDEENSSVDEWYME